MVSGVERAGGGRIILALRYRNAGGDRLAVQGVRIREEDGRAADAEIVRELVTQDCGGRDYTAPTSKAMSGPLAPTIPG